MDRVLLVVGDPELRGQVEAALGTCTVELATEEGSVRKALYEGRVDLLLLDAELRGDGLLADMGKLCNAAAAQDVPIFVLAAVEAGRDERVRHLRDGASDCLMRPFDRAELEARIGVQLRWKERIERLRSEALVDELTGAYNRRYLDGHLASELGKARRYDQSFSLVLFDLDRFKSVNDELGHPFGDQVLRETARLVRSMMRKEDVLVRYGGEEFALLLPHTDRMGAGVLGERVRSRVAENRVCHEGQERRITISLGAATYPLDPVQSAEEMIECADRRLYQAKAGGRDRVVVE